MLSGRTKKIINSIKDFLDFNAFKMYAEFSSCA